MTLGDINKEYKWNEKEEDDKGYYFILTDTIHHCDYNVVLLKDNGKIQVNGDYINNIPHEISAAILPRIDYFVAQKNIKATENYHSRKHEHNSRKKSESKGK